MSVGIFALRGLSTQASEMDIGLRLAVIGLGTGMFSSPNVSAIMGCAPRQRQGVAAATSSTARNLGQVFGVALTGAVFSIQLAQRTASQVSSQTAFFGAMDDAFLMLALIAFVGIITSLARGSAAPAPIGATSRNASAD